MQQPEISIHPLIGRLRYICQLATIWDCCSVDKIFKLLCDFGLFVWIQMTISI